MPLFNLLKDDVESVMNMSSANQDCWDIARGIRPCVVLRRLDHLDRVSFVR